MPDRIQKLRDKKQFDDAIELLIKSCESPKATSNPDLVAKLLLRHVIGRCLVLEWAAQKFANSQRHNCGPMLDRLESALSPRMGPHDLQLDARLSLIRAVAMPNQGLDTVRKAIVQHVNVANVFWNYQPTKYVTSLQDSAFAPTPNDSRNGPAFLWDLDENYRALFHDLAAQKDIGWLHPGLLLAGETLAVLEGVAPQSDYPVTNWIMFALESATDCCGLLPKLVIERVPNGRGFLLPDPHASAYVRMDETFAAGLQNAWYAAWVSLGPTPRCDYRWRVEMGRAVRKTPLEGQLGIPFSGRSAEGVLTCALRAAARDEELDAGTAMSAKLALPIEPSLALQPVDDLDIKCLNPNLLVNQAQFCKSMKRRLIHDVLVAPKQEHDIAKPLVVHHVRSIEQAEEHFHLWPEITRTVKEGIARRATQDRIALCGPEPRTKEARAREGCSYVQSPVSFRPVRSDPTEEKLVPLDDKATRQFVLGRWRPLGSNLGDTIRIRLFADSGMGKSVQLVVCEQKIASLKNGVVPIRLGKSSTHRAQLKGQKSVEKINWNERADKVWANLVTRCFGEFFEDAHRDKAAQWLRRKAKSGEVVFLIDALDQTAGDLGHLALFQLEHKQCPVIAAGRPETAQTRGSLFDQQEWHTLELQPLTGREQRRLLGRDLAPKLLLNEDEQGETYAWTDPEIVRKHNWQDLLKIPLLIQLMKQLARSRQGTAALDEIRNRHELYRRVVDELLDKGMSTHSSYSELTAGAKRSWAIKQYRRAALAMVREHNFDAFEGRPFDQFCENLGEQGIQDLVQADIVTMHGLLDRITLLTAHDRAKRVEPGLEWRHRSFLEYFAALELAELSRSGDPQDRQEVKRILKGVHACLDESGEYRTWPVWDAQRAQYTQEFRKLPLDWHWTLRFLTAELTGVFRDEIATTLIALGNPWVVYDCLDRDGLEMNSTVENLCRWLVHRNWLPSRNYTDTDTDADHARQFCFETARANWRELGRTHPPLMDQLLAPETRNAGMIWDLRELEPDLVQSPSWRVVTKARQSALDEYLSPERWVEIPGHAKASMSDFPVTNAVFEAFCASHRRQRDQYSSNDDQPAIYVSWYMAQEFCRWLTCVAPAHRYFLPHEDLWEAACRWNTPSEWNYWWGPEMDRKGLCRHKLSDWKPPRPLRRQASFLEKLDFWLHAPANAQLFAYELQKLNVTRTRAESIQAIQSAGKQHPSWHSPNQPGLVDMSGNVQEWCANSKEPNRYCSVNSPRSLRGGSWNELEIYCCSASRTYVDPRYRRNDIGFRACRSKLRQVPRVTPRS